MPLCKPRRQWLYAGCLAFLALVLAAMIVAVNIRGPVTMLPPEVAANLERVGGEFRPTPQPFSASVPEGQTAPAMAAPALKIADLTALQDAKPPSLEVEPMNQLGWRRTSVPIGENKESQNAAIYYRTDYLTVAPFLGFLRPDDDPETLAYLRRTMPLMEHVQAYIRTTPDTVESWRLFAREMTQEESKSSTDFVKHLLVAHALHASRVLGDDEQALGLFVDSVILGVNQAVQSVGSYRFNDNIAVELAVATESKEILQYALERIERIAAHPHPWQRYVIEAYQNTEEALRRKIQAEAKDVRAMNLGKRLAGASRRFKKTCQRHAHVGTVRNNFANVVTILERAGESEEKADKEWAAHPDLMAAAETLGLNGTCDAMQSWVRDLKERLDGLCNIFRRELYRREHGAYPQEVLNDHQVYAPPELRPLQDMLRELWPQPKGRANVSVSHLEWVSMSEYTRVRKALSSIVPEHAAFIGKWTLLGPYDEANEPHPKTLLAAHTLGLTPAALAEETGAASTPLRKDKTLGALRFGNAFELARARTYYALTYIRTDQDMEPWMALTANTNVSFWVGPLKFTERMVTGTATMFMATSEDYWMRTSIGENVSFGVGRSAGSGRTNKKQPFLYSSWPRTLNERAAVVKQIRLKKGITPVLIRIRNRYGAAAFQCAIHDEKGKLPEGVTFVREP